MELSMVNRGSCKLSLILLLILTHLSASATGEDKDKLNATHINSTYGSNLRSLLSSLSSDTGFYNASAGGSGDDTVNALAICRGDRTLEQCDTCVRTASEGVLQQCPNQTQAIIWYEHCMLRYSNEIIYGVIYASPGHILNNTERFPNVDEFVAVRTRLFDVVRAQVAAGGGQVMKVGVGTTDVPASPRVDVLMQCMPDLSEGECETWRLLRGLTC